MVFRLRVMFVNYTTHQLEPDVIRNAVFVIYANIQMEAYFFNYLSTNIYNRIETLQY